MTPRVGNAIYCGDFEPLTPRVRRWHLDWTSGEPTDRCGWWASIEAGRGGIFTGPYMTEREAVLGLRAARRASFRR